MLALAAELGKRRLRRLAHWMSDGLDDGEERAVLIRLPRRKLPRVLLRHGDCEIAPRASDKDRIEFTVPANRRFLLKWELE